MKQSSSCLGQRLSDSQFVRRRNKAKQIESCWLFPIAIGHLHNRFCLLRSIVQACTGSESNLNGISISPLTSKLANIVEMMNYIL